MTEKAATAYWTMAKNAHPKEFCAMIEDMTLQIDIH